MSSAQSTDSTLFATYVRAPLNFERGEGVWLETAGGERYMDLMAGIAVSALGHAHPHLVDSLKAQAEQLWHVSNIFEIPGQERLSNRLVAASFADRVFFTNSGTEAIEAAIKTTRRYHYANGAPERYRVITYEGAFHGRTLAAISAGGQEKYLEGFGPRLEGFDQVPLGDLEATQAAIGPETAAILIEPIQGEGGIRDVPPAFLRELRDLCDQHGLLLVLDEIQCGIGRTGKLFAHEWAGIEPDIMAIAKGIGGGFPLGACLATEEASAGMVAGTHGTTFGGNPLAMAVGNAVLDVILEDGFLESVERKGLLFKQSLASLADMHPDIIDEVRGRGLMLGLKLRVPNGEFVALARDHHILLVPAGDNVARIMPPLVIKDAEIGEAITMLDETLVDFEGQNAAA